MSDITKMIEQLGKISAKELNDLATGLQQEFGIEAMPMMSGGGGGGAAAAEESSEFDVKIKVVKDKIQALKAIKDKYGLSLGDAKAYVENEGRGGLAELNKKPFSKDEAKALMKDLEAHLETEMVAV